MTTENRIDYLKLDQIRTDGGTQARAGLDEATVAEYAETWQTLSYQQNGFDRMPPIVVYHDGEAYWLADGFHRVAAYRRFLMDGKPSASAHALNAEVKQGTRRDAVLYACGANAAHGLRRTTADKRRAVETLLRDEEWRQWSDRKIADACAVDHKTVAGVRADLVAGGEIPHLAERQGSDGKVYAAAPARPITPESRDADDPSDEEFTETVGAFAQHGYHLVRSGDRYTLYPPANRPGIANMQWQAVAERLGALERQAYATGQRADPNAADPKAPPPARPNAPAGWVWRENNSMRRIADGAIVGPYARLADVVTAAEVMDRERAHAAQQANPPDDSPAFDPARVGAIRSYLDAQRVRGQVYDRATFDHAFDLAHDIHDGDTYRAITQEIHDRTNSGNGAPKAGHQLGSGQPEPPPWPDPPEGWHWSLKGTPCRLTGPDGWSTANYNYPERALAEAQRRILSQPKAAPARPRLDADLYAPPAPSPDQPAKSSPAIDWREISQLAYHLGALRDQTEAWETWQRIGHALVLSDAHMFAINLLRMLAGILDHEGVTSDAWTEAGYALIEQVDRKDSRVPTLQSEGISDQARIPDIPDDSPLSAIHAAVLAVNAAYALQTMDEEEIRVNLAELKAASAAMDGLADHPDVSDQDYEELSHAIGALTTLLRERLEGRAVGV